MRGLKMFIKTSAVQAITQPDSAGRLMRSLRAIRRIRAPAEIARISTSWIDAVTSRGPEQAA